MMYWHLWSTLWAGRSERDDQNLALRNASNDASAVGWLGKFSLTIAKLRRSELIL